MKQLSIKVADERCCDEWWTEEDEESNADCIELAGSVKRFLLNYKCKEEKVSASTFISHLCSLFSLDIDLIEKENIICDLSGRISALREKNRDTQSRVNSSFKTAEKLVFKEDVEELLSETLPCECTVEEDQIRKRILAKSGDMELLVEVKMCNTVSTRFDIEPFREQVYSLNESGRLTAALLLFLNAKAIPNKRGCSSIDFIEGKSGVKIPVFILASDSRPCIQVSFCSIHSLHSLCRKLEFLSGLMEKAVDLEHLELVQKKETEIRKSLSTISKIVHQSVAIADTRLSLVRALSEGSAEERLKLEEAAGFAASLLEMMGDQPSSTEGDVIIAMEMIEKLELKKGKSPSTSDMTITQRGIIRRAGGMKRVLDMLEKKRNKE